MRGVTNSVLAAFAGLATAGAASNANGCLWADVQES